MESGSNHLWGVLSNAEWDLLKWFLKQIAWASVIAALGALIQKIRSVERDWWVLGAVFLASFFILYMTREGPHPVEVPEMQEVPISEPPTVSAPIIKNEQLEDREIAPVEVTRRRETNRKFSSLLRDFPANDSLLPLSQFVVTYKKVTIRANKSSYAQAKVFGQWFKEAQWEVVEVSDTLTEKFPSGITIRAPYNNGDAENVHTTLCKLGYRVNRRLPDAPLTVGIIVPPFDSITLEIGNLSSIH